MKVQIKAHPHNWPKDGLSDLSEWAIIIVDMQNDYCLPGYYMDRAGFSIERLRRPIPKIVTVLKHARNTGMDIFFTRHGELNMSSGQISASQQGDKGWEIVEELLPLPNEKIIEKSTTSAFMSSNIHDYLQSINKKYLAFCGNTVDCCVHSTLRSANDLKYKCLLIEDCCGAVNDELHKWSIESMVVENGVFGAVTTSDQFINSLN